MDDKLPKRVMEEFEHFCHERNIDEKKRQELLDKLQELYEKSMYVPGEAIGIIAAQSISEPATQMTMRSYTLATIVGGLTKIVQGLPRLIEIFDLRRTFEKSMTIFLKDKYNSKEWATRIAKEIEERTVNDIIKSSWIDLLNMQFGLEFGSSEDAEKVKNILSKYCEVVKRENMLLVQVKEGGIKELRKMKNRVLNTKISGTSGISRVVVVKVDNDWIIKTTGSNLKEILENEYIDERRTTTDDIEQIYEVFGIEAARNAILREAKSALDEQGLDVDIRHLMLVADVMAFDGKPKPIGRYGVAGAKPSVLARANFEETKKHLSLAGFYGLEDNLKGIVENVMIGKTIPVGTGFVKLVVDFDKLKKKAD
ncbi:MAG: DNA-directed RNA polymerase subunit A'' [Candidatus Aenigmatarchaeota archaeon]